MKRLAPAHRVGSLDFLDSDLKTSFFFKRNLDSMDSFDTAKNYPSSFSIRWDEWKQNLLPSCLLCIQVSSVVMSMDHFFSLKYYPIGCQGGKTLMTTRT